MMHIDKCGIVQTYILYVTSIIRIQHFFDVRYFFTRGAHLRNFEVVCEHTRTCTNQAHLLLKIYLIPVQFLFFRLNQKVACFS